VTHKAFTRTALTWVSRQDESSLPTKRHDEPSGPVWRSDIKQWFIIARFQYDKKRQEAKTRPFSNDLTATSSSSR
jgi:hypothetical protein